MRYFTKKLWLDSQRPNKKVDLLWAKAIEEYQAQLNGHRERLSARAWEFFANAAVHDAKLILFHVTEETRSAGLGQPLRHTVRKKPYPVAVQLKVLEPEDGVLWVIDYSGVRRIVLDFPSDEPLFHFEEGGFLDWGYHELTGASKEFLRHEILFSSGASVLIEFKRIKIRKEKEAGVRSCNETSLT